MKKAVLAVLLLAGGTRAFAQEAGQLGAGLVLGDPIGGTAKLWLDRTKALDLGIGGSDGDLAFWADLAVHGWDILPQPASGKLGLYAAGGMRMVGRRHDTEFGVRGIGGINYWFGSHPIELFAELGPVFVLNMDTGVDMSGGLGVRFYFSGAKK